MLNGSFNNQNTKSLMSEYASLLGDAVLRHRTRVAEHSARIETELANKVKSEFISNMSHELRTPLNTVIGFSKILAENDRSKLSDENVAEYASLIHDAAVHLLSVINDILDISKMQSGKYALNEHEIDLAAVLEECVKSAKRLGDSKNITLVFLSPPSLTTIRGEENKLAQIFNNIISNAIKFTPPGGTVVIEALRNPDQSVTVLVRDTGVGMSAEELSVALTPFGQVDGSRARWQEGTGLGLTIAKALTELHGGQLQIESEKERGTQVSVHLPSPHHVSIAQGRGAALGTFMSGPDPSSR
ncbi:MAG: HAMP domain-containing histidine kinase [Filomicrobium sp.]|nr:HAMP domain-containing histidine kinase [Filomicrobium sp.]